MYRRLKAELDDKIEELARFNEEYPILLTDRIFPEDIISQVFSSFHYNFNEASFKNKAYLSNDERIGITIGNYPNHSETHQIQQAEQQISKELSRFQEDLQKLIDTYTVHIKYLYLIIEKYTAKYTAQLVDKHYTLITRIHNLNREIAQYYIDICARPSASKDLNFQFYTDKTQIPATSGIYFICHSGEIIYIGHSVNLNQRVAGHRLRDKYYCGNNLECVISELDLEKAKDIEVQLIYLLKPKENTYSKE